MSSVCERNKSWSERGRGLRTREKKRSVIERKRLVV